MLTHHPQMGELLMCDFTGFKVPEMIKTRPVVVVSPRRRGASVRLCTVVPLSTVAPNPVLKYHHQMDPQSLPLPLRKKAVSWAKCDMLYAVSLDRLSRVRLKLGSKRVYMKQQVLYADLDAIRRSVIIALGLDAICGQVASC